MLQATVRLRAVESGKRRAQISEPRLEGHEAPRTVVRGASNLSGSRVHRKPRFSFFDAFDASTALLWRLPIQCLHRSSVEATRCLHCSAVEAPKLFGALKPLSLPVAFGTVHTFATPP